jgi:hypothetical protein
MINDLKWNVFFKVLDNKPLKTYEEMSMYQVIFGKRYL